MIIFTIEVKSIALRIILKQRIRIRFRRLHPPTKSPDEVFPLGSSNQLRILLQTLGPFHEPRVLVDHISGLLLLVQERRSFDVLVVVKAAEEAEAAAGNDVVVVVIVEVFAFVIMLIDDWHIESLLLFSH
ncbi:hypothetical protein Hanom_Chr05g00400791 [Helianthus anomalus]